MTKEEAIHILDNLKPTNTKSSFDAYVVGKAITMAIKALEQEPKLRQALEQEKGAYNALVKNIQCADAISRQAVLDGIDTYIYKAQSTGTQDDFYSFAELVVKALPPVKQEPKIGHWNIIGHNCVKCNQCGFERDYYNQSNYCPHCGCRMESEDKE